jgi:hypothetical protein
MEQVNIRIGPVAFDYADYDVESDVLYLHVGEPRDAEGEETPEGHVVRFEPGTQRIVGLTVLGCSSDPRSRWRTSHHDSGVGQGERRRPRAGPRGCLASKRLTFGRTTAPDKSHSSHITAASSLAMRAHFSLQGESHEFNSVGLLSARCP